MQEEITRETRKKEKRTVQTVKDTPNYVYARYGIGLWETLDLNKYNVYLQKADKVIILNTIEHDTGKVQL